MISSHILDELGKLADSFGIIHGGRLIDEFTIDELAERCGQYVTVKTDNNDKAVSFLKGSGFSETSIDSEGNIRINYALDRTVEITRDLVTNGIGVKEIFINNTSLEDYYLSVTGGSHNG